MRGSLRYCQERVWIHVDRGFHAREPSRVTQQRHSRVKTSYRSLAMAVKSIELFVSPIAEALLRGAHAKTLNPANLLFDEMFATLCE